MSCRKVEGKLSALIDGELAPLRSAELRAHLRGCDDCARLMRELSSVRGGLGELDDHPLPPALFDRVVARLEREPERRPGVLGWLRSAGRRWVLAGALSAAVAAGLLVVALSARRAPTIADGSSAAVRRAPMSLSPPRVAVAGQDAADAKLLRSATEEFRRAELHYRRAISQLSRIASGESRRWDAKRQRDYESRVRLIERAIVQLRQAAGLSPANPAVQEMLFAAYRRHIHYLRGAILGGIAGDVLPPLPTDVVPAALPESF